MRVRVLVRVLVRMLLHVRVCILVLWTTCTEYVAAKRKTIQPAMNEAEYKVDAMLQLFMLSSCLLCYIDGCLCHNGFNATTTLLQLARFSLSSNEFCSQPKNSKQFRHSVR